MFNDALQLWEKGCSVVPLRPMAKCPEPGFPLSTYFSRRPTIEELREWFDADTPRNLGLICGEVSGGIVALDVESVEDGRTLWRQIPTQAISLTHRGVHLLTRSDAPVSPGVKRHVLGVPCDIRANCSYICVYPSVHPSGTQYRWVDDSWRVEDLPMFDPSWVEDKRTVTRKPVKNLDAYLFKIESIQGNNGSAGLVRFCAVARDSGLSEATCMAKLIEWNQSDKVNPPWSLAELARACTRTYRRT